MSIWDRNLSIDCMLVTKMKLLLHWVTVKCSYENSFWGQGFAFETDCRAYTEQLYLTCYSTSRSKQKRKFCWRLSKSTWQECSIYLIHSIVTWLLYCDLTFHKRKNFLAFNIWMWNISDCLKKTRDYWNDPDNYASVH